MDEEYPDTGMLRVDLQEHQGYLKQTLLSAVNLYAYCDANLWCIDGEIGVNRLCVALLFPHLDPGHSAELSLLLPDYYKSDVFNIIEKILQDHSADTAEVERSEEKFDNSEINGSDDPSHPLDLEDISPHPPKLPCLQCDLCKHYFRGENDLKLHMKSHLVMKDLYPCNFCGETYKRKDYLQVHLLNVHKTEFGEATRKPVHSCQFCTKVFRASSLLEIHVRKHTGEKPFQCDICQVLFSTADNLNKHKKRHTGELKFICDICHKSLSSQSSLQDHYTQHTGERPHLCAQCGQSFKRSGNLYRHKKRCSAGAVEGVVEEIILEENLGQEVTLESEKETDYPVNSDDLKYLVEVVIP